MNVHPEFLADHTDIPNWHFIMMMPVHGACTPIQLTALVQINYFVTYKYSMTVHKLYVPITVEQLTSGQEGEKTEPGVNRKVAVDGQRFDSRRTYDYFTFTRRTNSISSLKTTMNVRLAIVMQNICSNYDAYSFEKLQRLISKLSR